MDLHQQELKTREISQNSSNMGRASQTDAQIKWQ